jgi:cytoskeletal protein CcmA (bactofilin family)
MKKTIVFLIVFLVSVFCFATPLFAFTTKAGQNVSISENLSDDIYAFGSVVTLTGSINGDLVTSASQIIITGNVSGDFIAAGGVLTVDGNIGDTARLAGGMLTVNGNVKKDLVAAGGQVEVSQKAAVEGDAVINGGKIVINGNVKGRIEISGSDVTINGKIGKDVKISAPNIKIGDNAEIAGSFNYTSSHAAVVSPNAKITGKTNWTKTEIKNGNDFKIAPGIEKSAFAIFTATWIGSKVINFLSLFILGIILLLALPWTFGKFNERMKKSTGLCAGSGAIILFGTPFAAFILIIISIILIITLIGAGLGGLVFIADILIILIYSVILLVSNIYLSFFLGHMILHKSAKNPDKYGWKVLAFLIGLAITSVVYAIPFAGWLAQFAGILFGLGGLVMIIKDWLFTSRKIKSAY